MNNTPQFYFNEEDGSSMCIITSRNKTYVGTAQCADTDRDMLSEKTGCQIAYHRAAINMLKDQRDTISTELQGLKKYYYTICQSKYYDDNSYMANMLKRQIEMREESLAELRDLIIDEKNKLVNYMNQKAKFYESIRKARKANSSK